MDARFVRQKAQLAKMRSWEVALPTPELSQLQDAVRDRVVRFEELAGSPGLLPVPEAAAGSPMKQDDDRDIARNHGDFTVQHQAGVRLFASFEHLLAHSEGWRVYGSYPLFHVSPEFTVLRGALESAAAAWWLLEPSSSHTRVARAFASKKKEASYEISAFKLYPRSEQAVTKFQKTIDEIMAQGTAHLGPEPVPPFPNFTSLVDQFGGPSVSSTVGNCWRECSSYAHGFDWAAWHHRRGASTTTAPYVALAEVFVTACDALNTVWTQRWLPLASATPPPHQTGFLPGWPPHTGR